MRSVPFEPLDPALYREVVRRALAEDLGWGDVTTDAIVPPDTRATGRLVARADCVLAGLDVAAEVFRQLDPAVVFTPHRHDAERCSAGDVLAEIAGSAAPILTAERTALNFLQRLSGIATLTQAFVDASGGQIVVLDTRKTTPTLRALERYAVRAGRGANRRSGLDDGVLIKASHVRMAGGVGEAVRRMKAADPEMPIEVEVRSLADADEAVARGADILMIDCRVLPDVREVVRRVGGRAQVEVCGVANREGVAHLAASGADYVSIGALTDAAPAADICLELQADGAAGPQGSAGHRS